MTHRIPGTRRAALAALALAAAATLAAPAQAGFDERFDPKKVVIPALNPIPKVTPQRSVLANGMVLYLLEDHSLPRVEGTVYFKATSGWAPAGKTGLASITGQVMRSGGSAAKPGDWMDDRLAAIGASVNTSIGPDIASGRFDGLSENTAELLGLLAEVLRRPAFPEDKIELAKVGERRVIAGRNDEMQSVLTRVAMQAAMGKDHPLARTVEYATVDAVTRDDLVAFHAMCFSPDRAILVVFGDFKSAEVKALVTRLFADWKKGPAPPPTPSMPASTSRRLVFAPKDDVTQSGVVLAGMGYRMGDPDDGAMDVFEQALGGGFQSRLFNRIRTQRGLAYSAGASAGGGFMRPGVFRALTLTRNDSVFVALDLMRSTVEESVREPFTEQETRLARESVLNSLVFQYEKPSSVLFRAAFYEVAGLPQDYLQRYQAQVEQVTPASMHAAAARKVRTGELVTIIVGKEKEFDRPLESAGMPVERVDISIPPPASKVKVGAASAADAQKARQWLRRAAELNGGQAAWAAVKTFAQESNATISMQGQSIQLGTSLLWALPDRMHMTQRLPMGEMKQGCDGKNGWRSMMGQVSDQPEMLKSVRENYERSFFHLFAHPDQVELQALPEKQTVDGVAHDVALVKSELVRDWQLFFGPDGQLARMEYADKGPNGDATFSVTYSDWRKVGALQYPFGNDVRIGGEPFMKTVVTEITPGVEVKDEQFAKPAN